MIDGDSLLMHTIYRDPDDYPGFFVVREYRCKRGETSTSRKPLLICKTLEEARSAIPGGSDFNLGRDKTDDPKIVETWI